MFSYEECAEINCEQEVQNALSVDPDSLDGLQTLASLRLSQNRIHEACQTIDVVNVRVVQIRDVVRSRTVIDEISGVAEPIEFQGFIYLSWLIGEAVLFFDFSDNPEFEFCIATAKILIECAAEDTNFANVMIIFIND